MAEQRSTRTFAVIGVVGRTFKKTPMEGKLPNDVADIVDTAERLGALITERGHAVLTGGHYRKPETSVKFFALQGAVRAADKVGLARLIGIVPRDITEALRLTTPMPFIDLETRGSVKHLYLHTGLVGKKRNEITGKAVDVLIALPGEKGTPEEVTAALESGRPVVFLNSWNILKGSIPTKLHPVPLCEVESAEEAVSRALTAIGLGSPRLESCSPLLTQEFADSIQALRIGGEIGGELANPGPQADS